ncbi:hypothetical protein ACWCW7_07485 [Nocardia tengchongensis]
MIARGAGQIAWWVFLIALLLAQATAAAGPATSPTVEPFDCDRGESVYTICVTTVRHGESWASDVMTPYGRAAFILVLLAAVAEAVAVGRLVPGLITIAVPIVSALIILNTLTRTKWWYDTPDTAQTVALIVVAIAIREVWTHILAPRITNRDIEPPAAPQD